MNDLGKSTFTGPSSGTAKRTTDSTLDLDKNTWLLGVTVGVPFFTGAILGLILTDPVTKFMGFGRRGAICVAGTFSLISVVGSAAVNKWEHLLGFRILLGAGMAGKASIVPILLSETSPKAVRGILLVFWQLFVAFGLAAGSVANLSVYRLNVKSSWRYMFIAAFLPALLLLSLIMFSPESPRWLLKESGTTSNQSGVTSCFPMTLLRRWLRRAMTRLFPDSAALRNMTHSQKFVLKAYLSLIALRGEPSPILAAGEIYLMHTRLIDEQHRLQDELGRKGPTTHTSEGAPKSEARLTATIIHIGWWPRVKLMFFYPGFTRRAHLAAAAVMISQQLCGINLLAFLADRFFRDSIIHHSKNTTPDENMQLLGASFAFMFLNFAATIIAILHIDKSNGRRMLLNYSFPGMALSLVGSALVLLKPGARTPAVIAWHFIFLACFTIAYSAGEGPAAFVISAEVFPLVNRELGMSLAVFWNFLGAGSLAVIAPWLLRELGQLGVLLLFSGTNLLAWFLCSWLIPDTGIEALEDVFQRLDIPTLFMLKYTLRKISWRITKPLDWILNYKDKTWSDSGFGRKPRPPRQEFEDEQDAKAKASQSDTAASRPFDQYPIHHSLNTNGDAGREV
ncbi:sugar transporter [Phaeosphaeria sp. MPI-PUGE-AT-0046c]|nr:sugar transporter [Phaeosphaeria sp. MPI-PUGE-AT-0046c]